MISRRLVLKSGAGMLTASSLNALMLPDTLAAARPNDLGALEISMQVADGINRANDAPSLDRQIAILWTIGAGVFALSGAPPPQNNLLYVPDGFSTSAISLTSGETQWEAASIQDGTQIHQITDELMIVTSQYRVAVGGLQVFDAISGEERWRLDAGDGGQNPPELVEGTIYIGMGGEFMALEAATGAPVWTVEKAQGHTIVQNGIVYVVCHDLVHENGDVLALDQRTGQEKWRIARPWWQTLQAPGDIFLLIENNLLFFHADDTNVHAVDTATGEMVWMHSSDQQIRLQSILAGMLIVASYTTVLALHAETGEEVWRFEDGETLLIRAQTGSNILVSAGPTLYALDAATGTIAWQFTTGEEEVFGGIRADEKSIFVAGQNLYGLDAATGIERMRYPLPIDPFFDRASLVIGQHHLFLDYGSDQILALGNVGESTLMMDVILRAAPSSTSPERGQANAGEEIESVGEQSERNGEIWVEATVNGTGGWIPLDAIDPSTLPTETEVEIIYTP